MSASTSTPPAFHVRPVTASIPNWRGRMPPLGSAARIAARRPDGSLICLSDLPEPHVRWTRLRKKAVVECFEHGLIPAEAVCRRYDLTEHELAEWCATAAEGGKTPRVWTERPRNVDHGVVAAGALHVDLDRGLVRLGDRTLSVSPSEWRILAALAEAAGAVVSTPMLMGALYGDADAAAGPKIADVLICRLRKRLGPEAARIVAIWGRGYRLDLA